MTNIAYCYRRTEHQLWTAGFYQPDGRWYPESDHDSEESAAARVHYLNGGNEAVLLERAQRAEAERDTAWRELRDIRAAIMRLPQPPREMGDGPDERVTNVLEQIEFQINLRLTANDARIALQHQLDAARAEVERLRAALEPFACAADAVPDRRYDQLIIWTSRAFAINERAEITLTIADLRNARAELDATAEKEPTK